jgi:hypothetical protein
MYIGVAKIFDKNNDNILRISDLSIRANLWNTPLKCPRSHNNTA